VAIAFTMTVLAGPIINTLMPEAYSESVIVLQILIWTLPPLMMVSSSFNSLTVFDREMTGANTSIFTAVMIVMLDLALIPAYGPRGAGRLLVGDYPDAGVRAGGIWCGGRHHPILRAPLVNPGPWRHIE